MVLGGEAKWKLNVTHAATMQFLKIVRLRYTTLVFGILKRRENVHSNEV